MTKRPDPIAEVDEDLAEALREWRAWAKGRGAELTEPEKRLLEALRDLERDPDIGRKRRVLRALYEAKNDRESAAKILGITARTLQRWMGPGDLDLWDKADKQAEAITGRKPRTPGKPRTT